jgi:uncharacterized protein (DUF2062 family)
VRTLQWIRSETASFQKAFGSAPEPQLRWDLLGIRRFSSKIWYLVLNEHTSPGRLAAAVFVGILIGISPFYGFHIIAALLSAWLLKLNKFVVWLGTNISIPLIAPVFAFASAQAGALIMTGSFVSLSWSEFREVGLGDALIYWVIGFPIVGSLVGGVLAVIVYLVARHRQHVKSSLHNS